MEASLWDPAVSPVEKQVVGVCLVYVFTDVLTTAVLPEPPDLSRTLYLIETV